MKRLLVLLGTAGLALTGQIASGELTGVQTAQAGGMGDCIKVDRRRDYIYVVNVCESSVRMQYCGTRRPHRNLSDQIGPGAIYVTNVAGDDDITWWVCEASAYNSNQCRFATGPCPN